MTDDGKKRMLITPPPGLLPPIPAPDDRGSDGVNTGSATRRIGAPQPPAPAFFPAVPGAPVPGAAVPGGPVASVPEGPMPAAPATGDWQLVLPDGSRHLVPQTGIVLGRNPVAPRAWPEAAPLALDDPAKTVSKSHAVVVAGEDGLTVIDLRSTNGTAVVHEGASRIVTGETLVDRDLTLVLGSFALTVARG